MKKELKQAIGCAIAFIGAIIGAGMASGAEIVVYFTSKGKYALFAVGCAVILICVLFAVVATYARKRQDGDIRSLCLFLFPRVGNVLYCSIVLGGIVSAGAMLAGAGALSEEFFSVSGWAGSAVTAILGGAVVLKGVNGIAGVCKIIVPVIIVFAFLLGVITPNKLWNDSFESSFFNSITSAGIYALYNIGMSLGLCASLGAVTEKRGLRTACLIIGLSLFAVITLFHISIAPCESTGELPVLNAVKLMGNTLSWLYALTLWGAIFSTLTTSLYNFMPVVQNAGNWVIYTAVATAYTLSFVKLSGLVRFAYPISGLAAIIIVGKIIKDRIGHHGVFCIGGVCSGGSGGQRIRENRNTGECTGK